MGLVKLITRYNHSLEGTEVHDLDTDGNPDLTDAERQRYVELGHQIVALFDVRIATRPSVAPLDNSAIADRYYSRPVVPVAMGTYAVAGRQQPVYVQPGFSHRATLNRYELAVRVPREDTAPTGHMSGLNSTSIASCYYRTDWEPTRHNLTYAIDFAELLDDVIAALPEPPAES